MPPSNETLELLLKFKDEASTKFKASMRSMGTATAVFAKKVKAAAVQVMAFAFQAGKSLQFLGNQLRIIGSTAGRVGIIILGPLVGSLVVANSRISGVRDASRQLKNEMIEFSLSISREVVPLLEKLVEIVVKLRAAFDKMDPAMKKSIVSWTAFAGVAFLVAGQVFNMVGSLFLIGGVLIALVATISPVIIGLILLGTTIAVLVGETKGWDVVWKTLGRTMDAFGIFVKLLVTGALTLMLNHLLMLSRGALLLIKVFAKIPGAVGEPFRVAEKNLQSFVDKVDKLTAEAAALTITNFDSLLDTVVNGGGVIEGAADRVKNAFDAIKQALSNLNSAVPAMQSEFFDRMRVFFESFSDTALKSSTIVSSAFTDMESKFTTVFRNFIVEGGKAKDFLKNFVVAFGEAMISMIAKLLAYAAVLLIINAIPGGTAFLSFIDKTSKATSAVVPPDLTKHSGGPVPSFDNGGEVSATLEEGEFVVRRSAAQKNMEHLRRLNAGIDGGNGGGGQPQIVNIWQVTATDAGSFRGLMQQNSDLVESMFQRAIRRNNGGMRESVRLA